jgi:hypothetical protein
MDSLEKVLSDIRNNYEELEGFTYLTINSRGEIKLHECKPSMTFGGWYSVFVFDFMDFETTKRLMSVCHDDWTKCCYKLPKSKPKYESDVRWVRDDVAWKDCDARSIVVTQCKDDNTAQKIQRQLEAQYKIIDIIQRTQNEIDPDWVFDRDDWEDGQLKAILCLSPYEYSGSVVVDWVHTTYRRFTCEQLCSSPKVMKHICENKLVTVDLLKQWQTGG